MLCRQRVGPRAFAAESRTSYLEPRALPATLGALPGLKGRNRGAQALGLGGDNHKLNPAYALKGNAVKDFRPSD